MKPILMIVLIGLVLTGIGCNVHPQPEVPVAAYGKVVDKLPDIPEAKQRYNYPSYVDLRHIHN